MIWPITILFKIITSIYNFPHFTDPYFIDEETEAQIVHSFTQHIFIDGLFTLGTSLHPEASILSKTVFYLHGVVVPWR